MKYFTYKDFPKSLRDLFQCGGVYQKAADAVKSIIGSVNLELEDPFKGIKMTKHGESRIPHCIKYDLSGYCRLVTIQDNGCCAFVFVGKHEDSDRWVERNTGFRLIANASKEIGNAFVTIDRSQPETRIKSEPDWSHGFLFAKLPGRYYDRIAIDVPRSILASFERLESISTDEEILELAYKIDDSSKADVFYDVFSLLRSGDVLEAKKRVDLYSNDAELIEALPPSKTEELESSDSFVELEDFEPEIIEHFMKSASFQQWMLFMHPEQRKLVERDFNGPVRLSGVSGSGKTCVVVKRAIHLAEKYPAGQILVLTLNKSLAKLISDLIDYACPKNRESILVKSFWQLCQEELRHFESTNHKLYDEITWKTNEHISEIWDEFYHCRENNEDAAVLLPVHQSLLIRQIFPKDYLKQELDYVRSALPARNRKAYISMERDGRAIGFPESFREKILAGLTAWEQKMTFVGVTDYLGLSTALHKYLDRIEPRFRCVLVDEVQDFGTIELEIIRKLAEAQENDIFLSGDIAQQVYTKHHKPLSVGLNLTGGRSQFIRRNYRNSREILDAAYSILKCNLPVGNTTSMAAEIVEPEYSNFSTPKPLLLNANSVAEEFAAAFNYYKEQNPAQKACIALCGYSLKDVKAIGRHLDLQVLDGTTNIDTGNVFLSDLEQTKGFEFDSVCIVNCSKGVIPDLHLPSEEWYRDLSRLYVAMTRAKRELILSYSQSMSQFIEPAIEKFVNASWMQHSPNQGIADFVLPDSSAALPAKEFWYGRELVDLTGQEFLHTRKAIGIPSELQNKLLEHVTGTDKAVDSKQVQWRTIRHALEYRPQGVLVNHFGPETYRRFKELFPSHGQEKP